MLRTIAFLILFCGVTAASAATAPSGGKANRLLNEASPYLQQHAYNPVDWYPWGDAAFEKARRENKPILLSVGYSTCHWCHVMERESYSDREIARIINRGFVAIKVDRERRPDVDETYMLATQLLTNTSGGWPNNVFLTPDLKPFYAGTYFPPDIFQQILQQVSELWRQDSVAIQREGERVGRILQAVTSRRATAREVTREALNKAVMAVTKDLDRQYGGNGLQPKFPRENVLLFLLDQAEKYGTPGALEAATKTLDGMIHGGIHDQVGGGFHRYTVDRKWLVPHFEKMLYNQAGIGRALVQAWRITGHRRYAEAARNLFDFVLRDLTAPSGGFYSAYDADSPDEDGEAEEGLYYLWTEDELAEALGKEDAAFATSLFGATFEGNFEGSNILSLPQTMKAFAEAKGIAEDDVYTRLDDLRTRLLKFRRKRKPPLRDEKILAGWNGYMIWALAEAGQNLRIERYKMAALKAAEFFWRDMGGSVGDLKRYAFKGNSPMKATQQDYALLAAAFVTLYDVNEDERWLNRAMALATKMNTLFFDQAANNYYLTASTAGVFRPKSISDGDTPSGVSTALDIYAKLVHRTLEPGHRNTAEAILSSLSGDALNDPESHAYALRAADALLRGETGARISIAKGRVKATAEKAPNGELIDVRLTIAEGWHINAHKPLEEDFVATTISFDGMDARDSPTVTYPAPVRRKLGFHDEELALLEGEVIINVQAQPGAMLPSRLVLTVQSCSDSICLQPETVGLSVLPAAQ